MKYYIYIPTILLLAYSFKSIYHKKYLPVTITFYDSAGVYNSQIKPGLIAAFKSHKVNVINDGEMGNLIKEEATNVTRRYYESGGDLADFNKFKSYSANNMYNVGTSIDINMSISQAGIVNDTVKWVCRTLPVKFLIMPGKISGR